jgi:hypothetical protein
VTGPALSIPVWRLGWRSAVAAGLALTAVAAGAGAYLLLGRAVLPAPPAAMQAPARPSAPPAPQPPAPVSPRPATGPLQ